MATTVRFQIVRGQKGWTKPPNGRYVTHGTPFGNPFPIEEHGRPEAVRLHREWLAGAGPDEISHGHRAYSRSWVLDHLDELRGRPLGCYCPLDGPCHADTLAALAAETSQV